GDLALQLVDLRLKTLHLRMLGLHELALLLILRFELSELLPERQDGAVHVAGRPGRERLAVSALRSDTACSRRGQCGIQLDERFTLERVRVAAIGLAV